jgi:hypothetical protein
MKFIFTDIDGVLNPNFSKKWNKKCVDVYNRICEDYNLLPVITSTWRIHYNKSQLQKIFIKQGVNVIIHDYTPNLYSARGMEINAWLSENEYDNCVVIDDKVKSFIIMI